MTNLGAGIKFRMAVDALQPKTLIEGELAIVTDTRVIEHVRSLLVEPKCAIRHWDYGEPSQQYPCWSVLEDPGANTGIAFCESGFGPRCPWGLVWLDGDEKAMSMGQDSAWYPNFLDAFFESRSATALNIWRVFRLEPGGVWVPLTGESSWEEAWHRIEQLRRDDPTGAYYCHHQISYKEGG